tara:strand:+ start:39386 stop:39943 length:558 start_codon:yes stop_codon:yes gene_type:complete
MIEPVQNIISLVSLSKYTHIGFWFKTTSVIKIAGKEYSPGEWYADVSRKGSRVIEWHSRLHTGWIAYAVKNVSKETQSLNLLQLIEQTIGCDYSYKTYLYGIPNRDPTPHGYVCSTYVMEWMKRIGITDGVVLLSPSTLVHTMKNKGVIAPTSSMTNRDLGVSTSVTIILIAILIICVVILIKKR